MWWVVLVIAIFVIGLVLLRFNERFDDKEFKYDKNGHKS